MENELLIDYDSIKDIPVIFNWDNGAYGASAAATWAKAPTGVYGGNQMAWPTSGTTLITPQNNFHPRFHGCKAHLKKARSFRGYQ